MDFHKYVNELMLFYILMALGLCELKDKAVTMKMNVIYSRVDTIFRPFYEAPI